MKAKSTTPGQKSIPEAKMGSGKKSSGGKSSGGKGMNTGHLSHPSSSARGHRVSC